MAKLGFLDKLLPPEEKVFYTYFEENAKICKQAAKLFHEIIYSSVNDDHLVEARKLKHASNDISKETLIKLNTTFITPIDREDIQLVNTLLNKITKKIIKACFNLRVYRFTEHTQNMKDQAETLVLAADELDIVVSHLRKFTEIKDVTLSNQRMREIESRGDEILHKAMDELFSGKYDALTVIKLRDIHNDIEKSLDICFDVSDEVLNIVLKHG